MGPSAGNAVQGYLAHKKPVKVNLRSEIGRFGLIERAGARDQHERYTDIRGVLPKL